MNKIFLAATASIVLMSGIADAQQPSAGQVKFFETNIRPALVKYCYECHSVEAGDSRGGLLLDTRMGLMQGGDAGPAIVPGDAESSLLWDAITWSGYEMPPSQKMPAAVIADFKKWIDMGAPDPRIREIQSFQTKITKEDIEKARREHWSFQPPRSNSSATIDRLVAEKLDHEGLHPSEAADGYTLLRRIYFDLVGLPPTPMEIQQFQALFKTDPDAAVKAKVDQLLKLSAYGERWGRHWLDVARYAESSGSRNVAYPHAWRYRDYVIDSFNDDTPYDRFIAEQIAGDLLKVKTDEQWQENLIATGFLAIGLKHHDEKNPRKFMSDMVDEQIDTMTQAVLGLTVACARCHDHKYDPIPTDDYYALAGILYSTKTYYGTSRIAQNHRPGDLLLLPLQDNGNSGGNRQSVARLQQQVDEMDRQMQGVRGKDRRTMRNSRNRVATQLASLNPDGSVKAFAMGVQEAEEMVNANILFGGEVETPAQEVPRGFVQALGNLNFTTTSNKSSGRLELVKAMTSKSNPLTARVMVNRIWMNLIGKPLVETPSNFGFSGMEPSNQKLLDHLAVRFMQHDWSVKQLIREIMLSETYRRSATYNEANYKADPDNKFLWRANPRQLDAESLRDAMLAVSGQLDRQRPEGANASAGVSRRASANSTDNNNHRSVYLPIDRDRIPEALDLFGFPDPSVTSPSRPESIVPTQALYLMNGDFVTAQASGMASVIQDRFKNTNDQARMAILWAYGRPATSEELRASVQFFKDFQPTSIRSNPANNASGGALRGRGGPDGRREGARGGGPRASGVAADATASSQTPLAVFCQTLMASASFRILN